MKIEAIGYAKCRRRGGRRGRLGEVAVAVEILRSEENGMRPITRDAKDGKLRRRDQDVPPEPAGLKALQH